MERCKFDGAKVGGANFARAAVAEAALARAADWRPRRRKAAPGTQSSVWQAKERLAQQTTLGREAEFSGVGSHSGQATSMVLHPAAADTGYRFLRTERGKIAADIPAVISQLRHLALYVVLGDDGDVTIGSVEHLLAALRGLNIDNCIIEIDGPEVPVMDGSARPFVEAIDGAGVRALRRPRKMLKVLKPVRVDDGASWAEIRPHSGFRVDVEIDFETPAIGRQRYALEVTKGTFERELAGARMFGFMSDVERLWKAGLALSTSLDNCIAIADDRILNPGGLRYPQEFARHKVLDAIGVLALAGYPIVGAYQGFRSGHQITASALRALLSDPESWTLVNAYRNADGEYGYAPDGELGMAAPRSRLNFSL
jgi:UDP-3-O-[3-hydroxymyristoyl] N-acetylglucosamine deacetylase